MIIMTIEQKAKAYDEALEKAKKLQKTCDSQAVVGWCEFLFPELAESEDERMLREIRRYIKEQGDKPTGLPNGTAAVADMIAWLEKQGKSSDQIHYWTEEEIEPIISDYLRGAEHYGGMIGRLRCLKPKSLEKQGEQKPVISYDALREGIAHFGITQYQIDNWLKRYVDVENQGEQKPQRMVSAEAKESLFDYENANIQQKDFAPKDEHNPAWSEEDEMMLNDAICAVGVADYYTYDDKQEIEQWLRSLKQRIGGKL